MDSRAQYNPRTVEEVFRDFKGRRAGLIKALTTNVEDFYNQYDPDKENLARFGFDKSDRKRLFNMINELPSIFEVVTGTTKKKVKEKSSVSNHSGRKSKSNSKVRAPEPQVKQINALEPKG
ncbi:hypothetical protein RYX36_024204 [Vicia faba]